MSKKKGKKCVQCRLRPATRECDWKVGTDPPRTCDAPLCDSCTYSPATEKDLCKTHKDKYDCWVIERGQKK